MKFKSKEIDKLPKKDFLLGNWKNLNYIEYKESVDQVFERIQRVLYDIGEEFYLNNNTSYKNMMSNVGGKKK